jgi:DNA repair exonuclease SbcCD ATPase subunit
MFNPRYIVHIADLHIGSNNGSSNRSAEYRKVFDNLFVMINNHPNKEQIMVVIAGDIFHHKIRYSGQDVEDFNYLMSGLSDYPTIIIPGNHDANLYADNHADLISPLLRLNPNVHYWKQSGYYTLHGVKFYHLSVFDELTCEEIEQRVSTMQDTILLYHGMIDGATFGTHVVKNERISQKTIASVRLLLAGDIHKHQFITPTAAYCGSLVQQNLSESTIKGCIVWDLNINSGQFVQIANDTGLIRLDLRGLTMEQVNKELTQLVVPKELLKVSIITDACDNDTDGQVNTVRAVLGRCDRVNRCISTATKEYNPNIDVSDALTDILLLSNATQQQCYDIVEMHESKLGTYECRRWYVTCMQWDNMFKYGVGNIIDFTKLEGGISGVIAANRAGKSSIIDILVFGLFGEHLRADKKSMINVNAKKSRIRIDFVVNDQKYYVKRTDDNLKHSTIVLCKEKIVENVSTWKNITETGIDITYRKIKGLIGSLDQFKMTGLYSDPSKDIIKLSKADRMKLLPELFGLVDNKSTVNDLQSKLKTIDEKIKTLVKPRVENPQKELDELNEKLNVTTTMRNNLRVELTAKVLHIEQVKSEWLNLRSNQIVNNELIDAKKKHQNIRNQLSTIKPEKEIAHAESISVTQNEIERLRQLSNIVIVPSKELSTNIAILQTQVSAIPLHYDVEKSLSRKNELESDLKHIKSLINPLITNCVLIECGDIQSNITQLDLELSVAIPTIDLKYVDSLQTQINKIQEQLSREFTNISPMIDIQPLQDDLMQLEYELSEIKIQPVDLTHANSLKLRVDRLKDQSLLKFNHTCNECNINKSYINAELVMAENELIEVEKSNQQRISDNLVKTTLHNKLSNERIIKKDELSRANSHNNQRNTYDKLQHRLSELEIELSAAILQNQNLSKQIDNQNAKRVDNLNKKLKLVEELNKIHKHNTDINKNNELILQSMKINSELLLINTSIDTYENNKDKLIELASLETQYKLAISVEQAVDILKKVMLYEQYQLCMLRNKLQLELYEVENTITNLENELKEIEEHIWDPLYLSKLELDKSMLETEISSMDTQLGSLSANILAMSKELRIKTIYDESFPVLNEEYTKYKIYIDALKSPNLKMTIIRKNIDRLLTHANDILKATTDFSIAVNVEETHIELLLVEGSVQRPVALASGFQQFIISIAIRLALNTTLPTSADFIMIDEGFGCMDAQNTIKVVDLFNSISISNQFTFIISHLNELCNMITIPLHIETNSTTPIPTSFISNVSNILNISDATNAATNAATNSATNATADPESEKQNILIHKLKPEKEITCECGSKVTRKALPTHLKSAKHRKFVDAKQILK